LNLNERNSLLVIVEALGLWRCENRGKILFFFCNREPATRTLVESVAVT
jgi:hypothetical protein